MTLKTKKDGKFEDWTEDNEEVASDHTSIYDGDWKVNIHKLGAHFGYRRYHKHEEKWHCVMSCCRSDSDGSNSDRSGIYVCSLCKAKVPDDMEGYINLAKWSFHDN